MSPSTAFDSPRSWYHVPVFAPVSRGMGTTYAPAQLAQQIGGITGTAATGALAAANLAGIISISSAAIPLIGAGIAAVTAAVSLILNSGCGQSCIITSNWANNAEQLLIQNIQQYFALPAPRSQSAQAVALANFDNTWNYLVQQCFSQGIGQTTAGQHCISDRQRGACTWHQTTTSQLLQYPGEPQPGQCWNWFSGYRDPIANDPNVAPDVSAADASNAGTGGTSTFGGMDTSTLILYGGIALLAVGLIGAMQ